MNFILNRKPDVQRTPVLDEFDLLAKGFRHMTYAQGLATHTVSDKDLDILFNAENVQPKTRGTYFSLCCRLAKCGFEPTILGLKQFLRQDHERLAISTSARMRTAVIWYMSVHGLQPLAADVVALDLRLQRYARLHVDTHAVCGALDPKQLLQALKLYSQSPNLNIEILRGMIMQWAFAFRGNQILTLTRSNFVKTAKVNWIYVGTRQKTMGKDGKVKMETHEIDASFNEVVSRILARHSGGVKMFTYYPLATVTKLLVTAASHYDWRELRWSAHSLRHGSVVDVVEKHGLEAGKRRTGHESLVSVEHYAVPNDQRRHKDGKTADAPVVSTKKKTKQFGAGQRASKLTGVILSRNAHKVFNVKASPRLQLGKARHAAAAKRRMKIAKKSTKK